MRISLYSFSLLFLFALGADRGWAQAPPLEQAETAFREERFEAARVLLEKHLERNASDADAQYLLARVYTETPLADERRARRALDAALKSNPDNVDYLTAQMMLMRSDRFMFLEDKLREQRRVELARRILALDPANGIAHEELGRLYIKDYWRYRNAISFPLLTNERPRGAWDDSTPQPLMDDDGEGVDESGNAIPLTDFNPNSVFLADRFDLDALDALGVPVVNYARRAQNAYDKAIGHLEAALEADPRRRAVYDDFMRIYTLKGDWSAALERLDAMYTQFSEDPGTWLYLGLAHQRAGNAAAADRSFRTALSFMDEAEQTAYEDIQLLLKPEDRAAYARQPDVYAQRFWTAEDPRLLTSYNERRLEHYARLTQADVLYKAPTLNLRGWETQRGRILVRYGPPQREVYLIPSGSSMRVRRVLQNPYTDEAQSLLSELRTQLGEDNPEDAGRDNLSPETSPFSGVRDNAQGNDVNRDYEVLNTFNIWDYGTFRFVFEDPFRNSEYRLYSPSARDIAEGVDPWRNDYVIMAREIERRMPQRYDYEAPGRRVELPYLVTSFRGQGGATDVYVHFGVSIPQYDAGAEQVDITANVGTFLVSPERDVLVERRRTLYGLRTAQIVRFEEANLWVDSQRMEAPPGEHELSVEFETASGGTVGVQRRPVSVPDFSGDRLALSDLLLAYRVEDADNGQPAAPGDLVRGDLSIRPAPWSVFRRNQPLYLYYEAYNLNLGTDGMTSYEVEIELAPRDTRKGVARAVGRLFNRKDGVSLRFPGSGNQPDIAEYQILDVADQEAGLYTLTLRVRDAHGRTSQARTQDLFLE